MLEARITKTAILEDEKTGGTVLMGVAQYCDDQINFKVPYDWETLDRAGFIKDLRDKLAEDFDVPVYWVDVQESKLLDRMAKAHRDLKVQHEHN